MRLVAPRARTALSILIVSWLAGAGCGSVRAEAPSATVDVVADTSGPTTRLILTHSRRLVYAVTTFEGRVEIVYADPVAFRPPDSAVDDGILSGWTTRGDRTLVLRIGAGYDGYDHFELRNPFRLVVDLKGDRAARPPQAPAEVPTPTPAPTDPVPGLPERRESRPVIVLDPGHGGIETGAVGPGGIQEKDVALDIARRVRTALAGENVGVVLTRDSDRLVDLDERAAIANHNRADLFVSIHLNASNRREARGAETYYLSTEATDDEARALAGIENASGRGGEPSTQDLRDRGLDLVLWDLAQNRYLAESAALAEQVQREMNELTGTRDRGVRQAPFRVLVGATMPAILVEVGFITNADEAGQFEQPGYRDRVALALARAIRSYLANLSAQAAPAPTVGPAASGQQP